MVHVTYYRKVISSWCFWAEPAWADLKKRYPVEVSVDWRIATMPAEAYPVSKSKCEWFYRRLTGPDGGCSRTHFPPRAEGIQSPSPELQV